MRILHTGDWHLGKTLHNKQRGDEHAFVLAQMLDFIEREQVDLMLLAGDVFETQSPSAEAEKLFLNFALEVRALGCRLAVIAGNHDGPRRFEAYERVLAQLGIVIGYQIQTEGDKAITKAPETREESLLYTPFAEQCVKIVSRDKSECARLVLLPFPHEHWVNKNLPASTPNQVQKYNDAVGRYIDSLGHYFDPSYVNLMMAHLMMRSGKIGTSERSVHVDVPYRVEEQYIPTAAQYVALGHLHRNQILANTNSLVCYAGSILQLDFGELRDRKGFMFVEVQPGTQKPSHAEFVELTLKKHLVEIRAKEEELPIYAADPAYKDKWIRLLVEVSAESGTATVGLVDRIKRLFPSENVLDIKTSYQGAPLVSFENEKLLPKTPEELYRLYREKKRGGASDDSVRLFNQLYLEALQRQEKGGR